MNPRNLLNPISTLAAGLLLGAAARLFDIYAPTLGDIFSQMAVWILLGTLIAIYSPTQKAAMGTFSPSAWGCCSPTTPQPPSPAAYTAGPSSSAGRCSPSFRR